MHSGHRSGLLDRRECLVRLLALAARLPRYVDVARRILALNPGAGRRARGLVLVGLAYLLVPLDPLPGFIPVLGSLDDALVALFTLRVALRSLPPPLRARLLREARLDAATVESDWRLVRDTARDLVVATGRGAWHLGSALTRGTMRLGSQAGAWVADRLTARLGGPEAAQPARSRTPSVPRRAQQGRPRLWLRRRSHP